MSEELKLKKYSILDKCCEHDHPPKETGDCDHSGYNHHVPDMEDTNGPRVLFTSAIQVRLFILFRWVLGGVFLYASYDKILHPDVFAKAVYNYQILPDAAINLLSLTLPWVELLIGACIFAGVWLPGATVISTGLLTVFIGALMFNQVRGLDIHCGCFSIETTQGPAGVWTVVRDIGFLFISSYLTLHVFFFQNTHRKLPITKQKQVKQK